MYESTRITPEGVCYCHKGEQHGVVWLQLSASILSVKKKVNTSGILEKRKRSLWGLKSVSVKPSPSYFCQIFCIMESLLVLLLFLFVFIFWGSWDQRRGKRQSSDLAHMTITINVAGWVKRIYAAESATVENVTSLQLQNWALIMPCGKGSQGTSSCCLQKVNHSQSLSHCEIESKCCRESLTKYCII